MASHRPEEAPNPPGASHRVTSEPLKKKDPITDVPDVRDGTNSQQQAFDQLINAAYAKWLEQPRRGFNTVKLNISVQLFKQTLLYAYELDCTF